MGIYNFVLTFIIFNIVYELIEVVFPIKKMRGTVKSFVLLVMLSAICSLLVSIF